MSTEIADASRVLEWMRDPNRKPAQLAFTHGPERQAAYWIEIAQSEPEVAANNIDARFTHRLAIVLECMILNPTRFYDEACALKVERDKLIQAVADHVTVREEQYRRIQALDAQARDHLVQLGAERNRALKAEQERDALRVEIEAHRGRADANGLRSIANAAVNGEMTTSRVCELINIWLAGNFTQDQLPPVRQLPSVPNKAAEDTGPWDVIEHMQDELGRLDGRLQNIYRLCHRRQGANDGRHARHP